MLIALCLTVVSCLLALVLTPIVRDEAKKRGWVDLPDHNRKLHAKPIPRVGGIAIVGSYLIAFILIVSARYFVAPVELANLIRPLRVLTPAAIIFAIGVIDDLRGLHPRTKLLVEITAATLAFVAGVRIQNIHDYHLSMMWSLPLTVGWLVLCTNAYNLIDGLDGLATGVALMGTVATLLTALINHNHSLALVTAPLAGALLGFLRYNFSPASIFLGDCGSLTIGFLLGSYGVLWSQKTATIIGVSAPLMAMAIPLLDTGLAIVRRSLRGEQIFSADRGHIHHKLLDRGLTPRSVALLLYATCALAVLFSIFQEVAQEAFGGAIILCFCIAALFGIHQLRYAEFGAVRKVAEQTSFRRRVRSRLCMQALEDKIRKARSASEVYEAIHETSSLIGLDAVRMKLRGQTFEKRNFSDQSSGWQLRITITTDQYVNVYGKINRHRYPLAYSEFADTVERAIRMVLPSLKVEEEIDLFPGVRQTVETLLTVR